MHACWGRVQGLSVKGKMKRKMFGLCEVYLCGGGGTLASGARGR